MTKPWDYLADQARFLLLTRQDTVLEKQSGDGKQDLIFKLTKGFRNITTTLGVEDISLCLLLAEQLVEDKGPLARSGLELISQQDEKLAILTNVAMQNPSFAEVLINQARLKKNKHGWIFNEQVKELYSKLYLDIAPSKNKLETIVDKQCLAQLFIRPDNPFSNEVMALKLMEALLLMAEKNKDEFVGQEIDLANTTVKYASGYSQIPRYQDFDSKLEVASFELRKPLGYDFMDERISDSEESEKLRKVAQVIRAALSSSKDATDFGTEFTPRVGYRGLKSTQTKRRIGLYTTPVSLAGEGAQVSSWLTTLLTKLLRWPGTRANEQGYIWPERLDIKAVKGLIQNRLANLKELYCQLSQMPVLSEIVLPDWEKDKAHLNVVMVQSKMPKMADFACDPLLDNSQYRTKHRRHIADVASMVVQHVKAEEIEPDLIVWPELAVHYDDLDILKFLSRKTHAIIYAGLGFIKNSDGKTINTAIWIVPRKHCGNKNEVMRFQGKHHMTSFEKDKIQPWRPYQLFIELRHPKYPKKDGFKLTGSICYDATDIKLAADLADKSSAFVISALNKDVNTFDSMVEALHYHMYQPVILVNTGEFGGSYAMAPYKEHHEKLIAHNTGKDQIAINSFQLNMFDFRRDGVGQTLRSKDKTLKAKPAGIK